MPVLAGCLALGGCSDLPHIVPDLSHRAAAPVQLVGAAGPLSDAQSRAVLDRLAGRGPATDIFDRHLAREDAIVGSPLTVGNDVRLLQDGPATYRAMLAAIAAAQDHINLETYILDDDEVGRRFADALIERQQHGVQVNLMHDSVGTLGTPPAFFDRLTASGVRVLEFNPVNPLDVRKDWELNQRDHRKLLIVDGRTAFLGGINISSVYSGSSLRKGRRPGAAPADGALAWRDTDLQLQGPVVAELQKLFITAWAQQRGAPLADRAYFPPPQVAGREVVRAIGSSPEEPFSLIYATLLSAIASAETSVHLTNAYFAPDPQLLAALTAAAGRGVDVTLILPAQTDSWLIFHAGRGHYAHLLEAGVKIFERRGVILHAKTALIDGVWATVGSTNLDWRSFLHNHELNAVVLGAGFGSQLQAMFAKDLAASDAIAAGPWARRPLHLRLKEWLAGLWAYWL
ncbi:phosphatidylserine/phosphatidylglycerophosphate/cardiolipin synthase family protein [Ideonella sp. A 288]|uniref:phospholipase D-like domain-containing protein n=1 Tax=Ideonella sp. A 288 TaxID=1962181 RepID=UPI001F38CE06|nr:phospholipase D-like domain-containing protein [Ideonella sp. A 288]